MGEIIGDLPFISQGTAISPAAFQRNLDLKTFTNGSDKHVVADMYAKTFETIKHTKQQLIFGIHFRGSAIEDYVEALAEFNELEDLILVQCGNVGDAGFKVVVNAIAGKPKLKRFCMGSCSLTDAAAEFLRDEAP